MDLRDIVENLSSGDFENARAVYINGRNSLDPQTTNYANKRSLQSFSTDILTKNSGALSYIQSDPTFAVQMYGLAGLQQDNPDVVLPTEAIMSKLTYADDFVLEALADTNSGTLAAEAMTSLNLWMAVAHKLWLAVDMCRADVELLTGGKANTGDSGNDALTGIFINANLNRIKLSFDEAMAYWIGADQSNGDEDGYALYAFSQKIGGRFGRANPEATANKQIKRLYEEGRGLLSSDEACTKETKTLYHIVNRLTQKMMIPLVQHLIAALKEKDYPRVSLYAIAVVPHIAACKPSSYRYLKKELLDTQYSDNKNISDNDYNKIIQTLQNSFTCLGFSCSEVGPYLNDKVPQCDNDNAGGIQTLAGYTTSSDVIEQSKIDLDILQIKLLTTLECYDMALLLYLSGKNSKINPDEEYSYRSLSMMATSMTRAYVSPQFQDFETYFLDQRYADTVIRNTLSPSSDGKWVAKSQRQKVQVVTKTLQFQVTYMFVMAKMVEAQTDCNNDSVAKDYTPSFAWDEVAAFLIGSLDQKQPSSVPTSDIQDGQLLWNLGNRVCTQFGTCTTASDQASTAKTTISTYNAKLEDLLYAGMGESRALDCKNLARTVKRIQHIMLIPLIQSTLKYAISNTRRSDRSESADLASGEIMALSILPILTSIDAEAAAVVEKNMILTEGVKPVKDGAAAVGDALYPIVREWNNEIRCEDIGRAGDVDVCVDGASGGTSSGSSSMYKNYSSTGISIVARVTLWISVAAALFML